MSGIPNDLPTNTIALRIALFDGKIVKIFHVSKKDSVSELYRKLVSETRLEVDGFSIAFRGKELPATEKKSLESVGIENLSLLVTAVRTRGGSNHGSINWTDEQCSITFDDSNEIKRVKMSCGHVYCDIALLDMVEKENNNGTSQLQCADSTCKRAWRPEDVFHILHCSENLDKEKVSKAEISFVIRYLKYARCPVCNCISCLGPKHPNGNIYQAICMICKRNNVHTEFCFNCGRLWKDSRCPYSCGNEGCDRFVLTLQAISENKNTVTIDANEKCPSTRLCPKCAVLIEHGGACKHMHCCICSHDFCFVCLKQPNYVDGKAKWPCGSPYDKCPTGVAPIQTRKDFMEANKILDTKVFENQNAAHGNSASRCIIS